MPTVPLYDGPKVRSTGLQGGEQRAANVSTERAGRTATAIGGALDAAAQLGERIQARRDLDDAFRVETTVLSDYSAFEANLRKTRRGASARDVTNDVDTWWSKLDDTYGEGVSPRVKELTKKSLARARAQSMEAMSRYQLSEEDRAQVESYNDINGQEIQNAITNGSAPAIEGAKGKIDSQVRVFGATRGWSAEQVAAEKLKLLNQLNTQYVSAMVDQNPAVAKAYFEANRSDIDSANHARMSKMINTATSERNATDNAAKWASLSFDDAIAKASAISDPDERKLTVAAVRSMQSDKNIASSLKEKAASDTVWQQVASGVPLSRLPKAVLEQMDGLDRLQVTKHYQAEQRRREVEAKGGSVKTDMAVFEKLMGLPDDEFRNTQFSVYVDKVSRGDIESLIRRKAALKDPKQAGEVATTEQQMGAYINTLDVKAEAKGAFQKAAYDEFNQFRAQNKREPGYEERRKILDQLTMQKKNEWYQFGPNKRFFEVPAAERGKFVDSVVPAADRNAIVNALNKRGLPVTAQTILQMYQQAQGK